MEITIIKEKKGDLYAINFDKIEFTIKRTYLIYPKNNLERGGHRHKITKQHLFCLNGSFDFTYYFNDSIESKTLNMSCNYNSNIFIPPDMWHKMSSFSNDCILLVVCSEFFDLNDYIYEK
jgi:dTDP-4-dehydrorhamnose 3,5-epimerase-like enzyme